MKTAGLTRLRVIVQASFALFCLYSGYRFYLFYLWAMGRSESYVPRPPAVEAFLPIGALVSLKRFFLTGVYDHIHPAGLTIFIAAILLAFFFRKGFCGWICPVGFVSHQAEKLALKLKILWKPPVWLDYQLLAMKYLLLGFFAFLILVKMDVRSIEGFNRSPYNMAVDAKMLLFFLEPTALTIWVMSFLVAASFFLRNFWCRYLCPYGALLGIIALVSPVRVRRDQETCIDCKRCEKKCPGSIPVSNRISVWSPECIGCLECIATCPVPDCLTVSVYCSIRLSPFLLPVAVVSLFLLIWAIALATGHWQTEVPVDIFKKYYQLGSRLVHP
ncbi:MAG: 4Fe-4S binding protein [Proteobacteria bacterium]|nr:4Fe-4S binding protein [Pseudomonadota bacterium]MBU1737127.1 4Fe-4S binding protein [Pseudomonadota bacterium]